MTGPLYMMGFVPRSGSTLLCQWLRSTGRLGDPREYFHPHQLEAAVGAFETTDAYVRWLLDHRSRGGVFGVKVTWVHLQALVHDGRRPADVFGQPVTCIWLDRDDREAQAISEYRAMMSGRWHSNFKAAPEPVAFNAAHIREVMDVLDRERTAFLDWWDRMGIAPLRLTYEENISDPESAVRAIAAACGVELGEAPISSTLERLSGPEDFIWKLALERAA